MNSNPVGTTFRIIKFDKSVLTGILEELDTVNNSMTLTAVKVKGPNPDNRRYLPRMKVSGADIQFLEEITQRENSPPEEDPIVTKNQGGRGGGMGPRVETAQYIDDGGDEIVYQQKTPPGVSSEDGGKVGLHQKENLSTTLDTGHPAVQQSPSRCWWSACPLPNPPPTTYGYAHKKYKEFFDERHEKEKLKTEAPYQKTSNKSGGKQQRGGREQKSDWKEHDRKSSPQPPTSPPHSNEPWACSACTFENSPMLNFCEMCGGARPPPKTTKPASPATNAWSKSLIPSSSPGKEVPITSSQVEQRDNTSPKKQNAWVKPLLPAGEDPHVVSSPVACARFGCPNSSYNGKSGSYCCKGCKFTNQCTCKAASKSNASWKPAIQQAWSVSSPSKVNPSPLIPPQYHISPSRSPCTTPPPQYEGWSPTVLPSANEASPTSATIPGKPKPRTRPVLYWAVDILPDFVNVVMNMDEVQSYCQPAFTVEQQQTQVLQQNKKAPRDTSSSSAEMEEEIVVCHAPALNLKNELHATLLFVGKDAGVDDSAFRQLEGMSVALSVQYFLRTTRLACASVQILNSPVEALCSNSCPHLTLALANGVPAKLSNTELEAVKRGELPLSEFVECVAFSEPFIVEGVVRGKYY